MHRNVRWIPLIVIIVILFSGILLLFFNIQNSKKLPCDYLDSINITDGTLRSDLSITFNDITYTNDQHFEISYVLKNGEKLPTLQPYRRGCICRLKPCVRLCCAAGTFFDDEINKCQNQTHPQAKLFEHDVLNEFNETEKWILDHHFAYVYDRPCQKRFIVDDNYSIINTGEVLYENMYRSHHEYCLAPVLDTTVRLLTCVKMDEPDEIIRMDVLPYFMLASVLFFFVTFLVYVCLPELRNLHGKCLLGYLMCMASGYMCLAVIKINGDSFIEPLICTCVGYVIYFSFISAFLWSNVISCDLWWTFQKTNGFILSERKRFILYMFYVWGLSLLLILVTFTLNTMESISYRWRIGIGEKTCFLKMGEEHILSRLLYFYLPLCIIWAINVLFFILTVRCIIQLQNELKAMLKNDSSRHQRKLNRDKENFMLYLRLSMLMGVTWIMEGISYFITDCPLCFLLTDIWNCCQGVLIFILFVLKRRVFRLIRKRCFCGDNTFGRSEVLSRAESKSRETTFT